MRSLTIIKKKHLLVSVIAVVTSDLFILDDADRSWSRGRHSRLAPLLIIVLLLPVILLLIPVVLSVDRGWRVVAYGGRGRRNVVLGNVVIVLNVVVLGWEIVILGLDVVVLRVKGTRRWVWALGSWEAALRNGTLWNVGLGRDRALCREAT